MADLEERVSDDEKVGTGRDGAEWDKGCRDRTGAAAPGPP